MKTVHERAFRERMAEARTQGYAAIVDRIGEFVLVGTSAELDNLRPGRFARERGLDRLKTVKAFLLLTKAGVFGLRWTVHCPHCKGGSQDTPKLSDLTRDSFCPLCSKGYVADFDRSVELSFRANAAVATLGDIDPFEASMGAFELEPGVAMELEPGEEALQDNRFKYGDGYPPIQVVPLQEFRDFFSKAMHSPNETFSIRSLAIVFTDIKGSTEMIERFDAFNLVHRTRNQIVIKVGIHAGPCIAVTLNERIDYFGTSVNTAARIQGLSDGRDIMVSERLFRESGAARSLAGSPWAHESLTTSLKGIEEAQEIYKLAKA